MLEETLRTLQEIVRAKSLRGSFRPGIGVILGSGLGRIADEVQEPFTIPYAEIPYFIQPTIEGHAGEMVLGRWGRKEVCVMKGRIHYYEGYTMKEITYPVRVMAGLGIATLIITGAAGGINRNFKPGDLVLITDHINFMGTNPLIGDRSQGGITKFTDMGSLYDKNLADIALNSARSLKIEVKRGIYIGVAGPSYETPAEIEMARGMGADLVGMSVVPEAIVGKSLGLRILGIACITNRATGISKKPVSHGLTLKVAEEAREKLARLLKEILKRI